MAGKIQQAAFRGSDGRTVGTGACHDISSLPLDFQVADEGFLDESGAFLTRDEAAAAIGASHPVESEECLNKSLKGYTFSDPVDIGYGQYRITAHHSEDVEPGFGYGGHGGPDSTRIGSLTFSTKPVSDERSPYHGYHKIGEADVHPYHRGKGVYGRMLQLASGFVRKKHKSKGLVSISEWRSEKAHEAWERLAARKANNVRRAPGREGVDFFMSELGKTEGDSAEVWYHITDNPQFSPDPHYAPEDNSVSIYSRAGQKGLYLTQDVENWVNGHNYVRPYVAEFHVHPSVKTVPGVHGRYGGEMFVPSEHFDKMKLRRVIPIDAHAREEFGDYGWIESHHGTEFDTGNQIARTGTPGWAEKRKHLKGYSYTGPDVRSMTPQQHEQHMSRWKSFMKEGRGIDLDADPDAQKSEHEDLDKVVLDPDAGYKISHENNVRVNYYELNPAKRYKTSTIVRAHAPDGTLVGSVDMDHDDDGLEVGSVQVHPEHRRKGIASAMYAHAEKFTGLKVKPSKIQTNDGKALWAGNAQNKQFGKSEHEDETSFEHIEHEFEVEFRRWLEFRKRGEKYVPPERFSFAKAEAELHSLAAKHGNLKNDTSADHHDVARQMAGYDPEYSPEFVAAKFLAGGKSASEESVRAALILYDDDFELAALRAYGLPRNESYREKMRAVIEMLRYMPRKGESAIKKSDIDVAAIPRDIKPATPSAEKYAEMVRRAQNANALDPVQLDPSAKHSKGTAIASDPESATKLLLKPGSGALSPCLGVHEELANQSQREVAFSKVAEAVGLSEFFPSAELLLIDGKEVATLELLGTEYKGLDKLRQKEGLDAQKLFEPYLEDGTLYKWAFLDWVLGNPDRHANNIMVDDEEKVMLIDHGTTFAGPSFNPAKDPKSFTPYYLRAWSAKRWSKLSPEEREAEMPGLSDDQVEAFAEWVDSINEAEIAEILTTYGISHNAVLSRLQALKESDQPLVDLIGNWSGALS